MLSTIKNQLVENCFNYALIAAVVSGRHRNVTHLILHGASNIDKALEESRRLQRHAVTVTLLIIKAAIENDQILILKLYGEDVHRLPTIIPLTEEDNLVVFQRLVCEVDTKVPIEIAKQHNASAVMEELLMRTGINMHGSTVLWSHLQLADLKLYWLLRISCFKDLKLAHNMLTSLPLEIGSYLKQCTKLDLQGNLISKIPPCLLELPNITDLNLSRNNIVKIPKIPEWSVSLLILDLSYNRLNNLPDSAVASGLEQLNISHNQFHTIPICVCSFICLTTLNIAYNSGIRALPPELSQLKNLSSLTLDGLNNLKYPPKKECVTTAKCIRFLSSQLHTKREYYHMKLVLLGKKGVGKSTLVARLLDEQISKWTMHSLNVYKWEYAPSFNEKIFYFTFWDFIGQEEVCNIICPCFLSKRSLFLLVWDVTDGYSGVAELKLWLKVISVRAPNSCVIVVGTFLDQVSKEDRQSGKIDDILGKLLELTAQYKDLNFTYITAVGLQGKMENVIKLKNYIYNAASEYKMNNQYVMGAKIPLSYHTLIDKLATIRHKVKEGEHKPIMHAVDFKKMVRDLNLVDIQDDEDLRNVTQFLHEDGALLHYDDWRNNLDDLYFVDPQWLYSVIYSFVVSVKQSYHHVKAEIWKSKDISLFYGDGYYFQQGLTLLDILGIALPLDNEYERVLLPFLLPKDRPMMPPKDKDCFKYFIVFRSLVFNCYSPTPLGLWSRLVSHVMYKIKEVMSIINKQIIIEEIGGSLVYWRTGLFYSVNSLFFIVEGLTDGIKNEEGVLIMCSRTAEGQKILGKLVDVVKQICEWYPKPHVQAYQYVPCHKCVEAGITSPCILNVCQLMVTLIYDHKLIIECANFHKVQILDLAPDLLMADLDPAFYLNDNEVIYYKENVLGSEELKTVYQGEYRGQPVAVKLYIMRIIEFKSIELKETFARLQLESRMLQQLHHPCLVRMIGVIVHPTVSLVLERAPQGRLHTILMNDQISFSRLVTYRIAIQVVSALHYLHSVNFIHCNLKASDVILWSLSPDHLINCKISDFDLAYHANPGGSIGLHRRTYEFIAPEVAYINHAKEWSIYDHRIDIFSFGTFLYELIVGHHPFQDFPKPKIKAFIKGQWRPQLQNIPGANTSLFYMYSVMKTCWAHKPMERPTTQVIIKWLSAPALQMVMSVTPIESRYSINSGCIVTPDLSSAAATSGEIWICCDTITGFELNIYKTNTMQKVADKFVNNNQVCCIKQCGAHVWVPSLEDGVVSIFNQNSKDLVHTIQLEGDTVSCITNCDQLVYMGTVEGHCYAYPIDIHTITPCYKHVSDHCIDGVVVTETYLWASAYNQIYFLNSESLELISFQKRPKNTEALVGKMMLSDNEDQVWSAHLGGVIMSLWDAHQRVHLCDVDVGVIAEEKCHVGDHRDQIITAMCTGLDTVWIGLASGHIIVFGMNPPGEVLTYFRPYHSYVRFLSAVNYPGSCEKEKKFMMLSGGKMYQPDDSFKELPDYPRKDRRGQPVDTAGVAILWEVIPAKYVRQLHYLRDGEAWSSYDMLKKAMIDTGFTESLKYCHPTPNNSSTAAVPHNDTPDNGTTDHQQVVKEQDDDTLCDGAAINAHNNVTSQSEQLSANLPSGEQLTVTYEQPVVVNSSTS